MNYHRIGSEENGSVSIFSVVFFIIIISILTISFVRIVNIEQQQAIDNSSSASALAAARSGIEDGKRVLLHLKNLPDADPLKITVLSGSAGCSTIYSSSDLQTKLGLQPDGRVFTSNATGDGQYVTCLTVANDTATFESQTSPGNSVIVPLRAAGAAPISSVRVAWHRSSTDGQITATGPASVSNPSLSELGDRPSYLRLQLIAVPRTNITRDAIQSKTAFLAVNVQSTLTTDIVMGLDTLDDDANEANPKLGPQIIGCDKDQVPYACGTVVLGNPSGSQFDASLDYYLRVTAIHKKTSFQVSMKDALGNDVLFDNVQPSIDSTGKTGNTFRRLKARVSYTSNVDIPEYVAEAFGSDPGTGDICKNMKISGTVITGSTCGW
ncbi:MAG: hypothetical protein ACM3MA_02590 [Acidobacteriota bacterium]